MSPKTQGISPKTFGATYAPVVAGLIVALINWAVTGMFDSTSLAAALSGLAAGALSGGTAYVAHPGIVTFPGASPAGDSTPMPAPDPTAPDQPPTGTPESRSIDWVPPARDPTTLPPTGAIG